MSTIRAYTLMRTLGDGSDGGILGFVSLREDGWRFMPNVSGRSPSRKAHETFDGCIPRWTGHPDRTRSVLIPQADRCGK